MRKDNGQGEKVYATLDAYQAGFLTLKGHPPKFFAQGDKIVFVFDVDKDFYEDLTAYNSKDWGSNLYPLLFKTIVKKAGGKISQE